MFTVVIFSVSLIFSLDICKATFGDTKGVIRNLKSKKDRQYNGLPKKDKRTNNDLQSIAHNTTDGATRTPLKIVVNSGDQDESAVPAPLVAPVVLL